MRLHHGWFAACVLAAGCGSISDNGNNIDAAVIADTTAPAIMSSVPAKDATNIAPLMPISIMFDEPLDPASVTADNVKVTYLQLPITQPYFFDGDLYFTDKMWPGSVNEPIRGDVSYDEALNKIIFIPKAPLLTGQTFTVSVTGVKDVAGNAYAGMPVKFQTAVNAEAHRYRFNSSSGVPISYLEYNPDMTTGRITRQGLRGNTGADTIWHTDDDPLSSLLRFDYSADGRIKEERVMLAGADGAYGTSDDGTNTLVTYSFNADNQLTERAYHNTAGADGMFGTSDDILFDIVTATYESGQVTGYTTSSDPGTDTQWRTADDKCIYQAELVYMGVRKQRDVTKDCGPDQLPKTADDAILQYREYTYDTNGQVATLSFRTDVGPDGMWFTVDDRGGSEQQFERDQTGNVTKMTYKTIGADQKWNTADDDISYYEKFTLDAKGLVTEDTTYNGKGPDNMWNTADDLYSSYILSAYDVRGLKVSAKTYNLGADGMPKTADDRVIQDSRFELSH